MKMIQLTTAGLLLCASLSATTQAQSSWPQNARRPSPVRQTGFEYSANDYVVIGDEATKPGASPSDQNAPPVAPAAGPAAEPAYAYEATEEEFRLFRLPQMECRRIEMRGWLDQGYTWNPDNPANRFNGPMTFNDRANEYQLNQLYLITERRTNTECRDFDWGGRVDFLYGTDYRFTRSRGLEENWEINDDHRFYGLAMPQLYADLAWRDWVFRFGHFYTMLGYEVVTAPDNFFYSHTYTHQYGEPFTHTGFLAKRKLNDRLSVSAGFQRGWDQWEDLNDKLGFLGNVSWTSLDERTGVSLGISTSNEQPVGDNVRTIFSGVFSRKLSEKMKYVAQFDYGFEDNALDFGNGLAEDAQWYGLVNYLFYELNDRWSVGARYEWFSDEDGFRVVGAGYGFPSFVPLSSAVQPPPGIPANWNELALGMNYKPNANLLIRGELRWDWFDGMGEVSNGPFDDLSDKSQFTVGSDVILKF